MCFSFDFTKPATRIVGMRMSFVDTSDDEIGIQGVHYYSLFDTDAGAL